MNSNVLSVCMIAKNESAHIARALESVEDADEIIVVDTGSEDNTAAIARRFTDKVYVGEYVWCDDFAGARNFAQSKAVGDWTLAIDADEWLEPGGMAKIRAAIADAEKRGKRTIEFRIVWEKLTREHPQVRVYRSDIKWERRIHNKLAFEDNNPKGIVIYYAYSEAHKKDPDRALRILKKVLEEEPTAAREKFFLAREYRHRGALDEAAKWYKAFLAGPKSLPYEAEAWFQLARCYWLKAGAAKAPEDGRLADKARSACLEALICNANFREAAVFIAHMVREDNRVPWLAMASMADNRNVLFVRRSGAV